MRRILAGSLVVALGFACGFGTGAARSRLPQAGTFLSTLRIPFRDSVLPAASGRSLFAVVISEHRAVPVVAVRVEPDGRVARRNLRFGLARFLSDVSAGRFGLYAGTSLFRRTVPPPLGTAPDELIRIDPATLGIAARAYFPARVVPLAAGGQLWASVGNGRVVRLDPRTLAVVASTRQIAFSDDHVSPPYLSTPALGLGSLWVLTATSSYRLELLRLDPETLVVRSRTTLPVRSAQFGGGLIADRHHLYVAGDVVLPVDADGRPIGRPRLVSDPIGWFQIHGDGLVGIVSHGTGTDLVLLDSRGRVRARTALPGGGSFLTVSGGDAWFLGNAGHGNGIVHVRLNTAA